MRAAYIVDSPNSTSLEMREVDTPKPGPKQLLVRVHAASLNRGELLPASGAAGGAGRPGGGEAAGEVVSAGAEAGGFAPGTRVMGRCKGGFAEYALIDVGEAIAVPESMSWDEAGATPIVFLVAYDMLFPYGRIANGSWVLVTAVSSGVGVACLQLAKAAGAKVIGTSGSSTKLAKLASLGLDAGLGRDADLAAEVLRITDKHGADISISNVGGSAFPALVRAAAYRGRIAVVGYVDGVLHAELDLGAVHSKRIEIFGVSNKLRSAAERAETVAGFKRDCLQWFADGRVRPLIDRSFGFDEIVQAKQAFDRNEHIGKFVIRM